MYRIESTCLRLSLDNVLRRQLCAVHTLNYQAVRANTSQKPIRHLVRYLAAETMRLLKVTIELGVQLKVLRTAWIHICVNNLGQS